MIGLESDGFLGLIPPRRVMPKLPLSLSTIRVRVLEYVKTELSSLVSPVEKYREYHIGTVKSIIPKLVIFVLVSSCFDQSKSQPIKDEGRHDSIHCVIKQHEGHQSLRVILPED